MSEGTGSATTEQERLRAFDFAESNYEDAQKRQQRAVETLGKIDALVEATENALRVAEDSLQANLFADVEDWVDGPDVEDWVYLVVCAGKMDDGKRCGGVLKTGHAEWNRKTWQWRPEGFRKRWRCRRCGEWVVPEVVRVGKRFGKI